MSAPALTRSMHDSPGQGPHDRASDPAREPFAAEGVPRAAQLPFAKCYAEGNAYVVVFDATPAVERLATWVADPLRGLGGDGLIAIDGAPGASAHRMRVFNADGSEAEWCGNGARAACALIAERDGLAAGDVVTIASLGGTAEHELLDRDSWRFRATMAVPGEPVVAVDARHGAPGADGRSRDGRAGGDPAGERQLVQMEVGAPHLIAFGPRPHGHAEIDAAGRALCATRPGGTNVMFASHDSGGDLTVTPWERGVGPVLGCATGGAAAAIAAERVLGRPFDAGAIRQPGGAIEVEWDAGSGVLAMTGTVEVIATGTVVLERAQSPTEDLAIAG